MSRLATHLGSEPNCIASTVLASNRLENKRSRVGDAIHLPFPYRLFVPESYEPGYAYPLVVWMHSDLSSEMEIDGVMEALSRRNYVALAMRGNLRARGSANRFRWGQTATDCAVAEDLVWTGISSVVDELSINPAKMFIVGFGTGGTMAQWIGLKYAAQLAGVVSIQGAFPKTPRALSNWKSARKIPTLFIQRQGSTLCDESEMARALKIAHQSGLNYKFIQARSEAVDEDANGLDASMLETANRFMMGIVTDTNIPLSPEPSLESESTSFGWN